MELFSVAFRVFGVPKAQPRARAVVRGAHAGVYDPGTAEGWKARVVFAAREHKPPTPLESAIAIDIDFYFPRPKSLCRKKDPDGVLWHTGKPDRDNCEKAVLDALTQDGWFANDSIVCCGEVRKFIHGKGAVPGAEIRVRHALDPILTAPLIPPTQLAQVVADAQ